MKAKLQTSLSYRAYISVIMIDIANSKFPLLFKGGVAWPENYIE